MVYKFFRGVKDCVSMSPYVYMLLAATVQSVLQCTCVSLFRTKYSGCIQHETVCVTALLEEILRGLR